jgi:putative transposase
MCKDQPMPRPPRVEYGILGSLFIHTVTDGVAAHYRTSPQEIRKITRGPQEGNEARKVSMYLCQELSAAKLTEIADHFNLHHAGSVSAITHQVRKKKRSRV